MVKATSQFSLTYEVLTTNQPDYPIFAPAICHSLGLLLQKLKTHLFRKSLLRRLFGSIRIAVTDLVFGPV